LPSDPVVVYDHETFAVTPDAGGFTSPQFTRSVFIPPEMYATWFAIGFPDLSGTPGPIHIPVAIVTLGSASTTNGAFAFLGPHNLASVRVTMDSGGVALYAPPNGAGFSQFPSADITSQSVSVSLFSNFTSPGPTVTLTDVYFAFVDAQPQPAIPGAPAQDADAGFLTELATVSVTQIGVGGRGRVLVIG